MDNCVGLYQTKNINVIVYFYFVKSILNFEQFTQLFILSIHTDFFFLYIYANRVTVFSIFLLVITMFSLFEKKSFMLHFKSI